VRKAGAPRVELVRLKDAVPGKEQRAAGAGRVAAEGAAGGLQAQQGGSKAAATAGTMAEALGCQ